MDRSEFEEADFDKMSIKEIETLLIKANELQDEKVFNIVSTKLDQMMTALKGRVEEYNKQAEKYLNALER